MFSALIGHTRALLPQGELEGVASDDVGDFEHTPPPSNRASLDISKDEAEKPAASKRIDASLDTTSRHRLHKTSFNGSKFASKDKPASPASTPFSKTKSSMPLAEGLGAISGPPYHKPSSPQNGSAIDSIRTKPLMLSQDTHPSKGTVALAELYTSIEPMETSRDELQKPQFLLLEDLGHSSGLRTVHSIEGEGGCAKVRMRLNSNTVNDQKPFEKIPNQIGGGVSQIRLNNSLPHNAQAHGASSHSDYAIPPDNYGQDGMETSISTNEQSSGVVPAEAHSGDLRNGDESHRDCERSAACTGHSGRSRSSGSIMNYLWKSNWLNQLSTTARSDSSRLTDLPPRTKSIRADDRRPSEPLLPSSRGLRRLSVWSNPSDKSVHEEDGTSFNRTFNDLERLLDNALLLALEVADHSEAAARINNNLATDSRVNINGSDELAVHNTHENFQVLGMSREDTTCPIRPECSRSATSTNIPKRPRLVDIVESYSGTYKDLQTRSRIGRRRYSTPPPRASLSRMPGRQSRARKADPKLETVMLGDLVNPNNFLGPDQQEGSRENSTVHKRSAALNVSSGVRTGSGHDALPGHDIAGRRLHNEHGINLRKRSHVSLRDMQGFNLPKSHVRQPIARDWSPIRKRFVASVACLSTALIGVLLGIYTGLVPSIQYYIVDQSHVAVHGNTGCFLALALPSFFLWPLPLLHGRKPYIMSSLILAMPLLFPQAIAVSSQRLTNTTSWRVLLLVSRTLMGGSLGFASMNFHSILTDLFGASLMCRHPHQEIVDQFDARRHGGGMGVWLGIWTWCWIGSLGLGFLIGAAIIDKHPPAWGFYVSIMLIAVVLILNVVCPEVRRSAFRRSIAEVRTGGDISRRLARGEVMMHRIKTGPKWWGQEAYHGVRLSLEMLEQPGFAVMAVYVAWIYAQVVLVIILLGSLVSRFYHLRSPYVGLHVAAIALGAVLAIPFQKASFFSRSRHREGNSNRESIGKKVVWSSHLIRRATFTIALPIGGACYTAVSSGPPISSGAPAFFALCMGFLSCLAIAECNGLIMETFDTSDLTPGMVGRHRDPLGQDQRRTNYSSFPRVTAGFAIIHSLSYILAAGSTALGGHVTRKLGQQVATSIVAGTLFMLTVLLLLVLIRFKNVLIIPRSKSEEMEKITQARRRSTKRRASMPNDPRAMMEEDYAWRPAMTGNPVGKNRRMNVLEMGNLTRWQDIQRRNKLIDAGVHLNRDTLDQGLDALDVALENHVDDMRQNAHGFFRRGSLRRHGSRLRRSNQSSEQTFHDLELDTLDPVGTPSESSQQPRQFVERECVMGQTIKEENKDETEARSNSVEKLKV
ncbi:hypothetical protein ACHAQI_004431 [Fusarium lateritium]